MLRRETYHRIEVDEPDDDVRAVDVTNRYGHVHIYESAEGLIIDVWVNGIEEQVFTMAIGWEDLVVEELALELIERGVR